MPNINMQILERSGQGQGQRDQNKKNLVLALTPHIQMLLYLHIDTWSKHAQHFNAKVLKVMSKFKVKEYKFYNWEN